MNSSGEEANISCHHRASLLTKLLSFLTDRIDFSLAVQSDFRRMSKHHLALLKPLDPEDLFHDSQKDIA